LDSSKLKAQGAKKKKEHRSQDAGDRRKEGEREKVKGKRRKPGEMEGGAGVSLSF